MIILMVNKFYYIKGGSETYYFALKRLLESKGHTVVDFSTALCYYFNDEILLFRLLSGREILQGEERVSVSEWRIR